jgi:hypothetical protein
MVQEEKTLLPMLEEFLMFQNPLIGEGIAILEVK